MWHVTHTHTLTELSGRTLTCRSISFSVERETQKLCAQTVMMNPQICCRQLSEGHALSSSTCLKYEWEMPIMVLWLAAGTCTGNGLALWIWRIWSSSLGLMEWWRVDHMVVIPWRSAMCVYPVLSDLLFKWRFESITSNTLHYLTKTKTARLFFIKQTGRSAFGQEYFHQQITSGTLVSTHNDFGIHVLLLLLMGLRSADTCIVAHVVSVDLSHVLSSWLEEVCREVEAEPKSGPSVLRQCTCSVPNW